MGNFKHILLLLLLLGCKDDKPSDQPQPISDIEGNVYNTVKIGNQVWLKENLRVSSYANGVQIDVSSGISWGDLVSGSWCYYNDNASMNSPYGKLYNWYAVTDTRKLCPNGWHVPNDSEWTQLENYLGGSAIAGGKLKETGNSHWQTPNTGASNSSGFTGLPGGNRRGASNSIYEELGTMGRFWTSSEVDINASLGRDLVYNGSQVVNGLTNQFSKKYGFSVRCVKD